MRTTIEITDEQRARLLSLAASRGLKGFSLLVREALNKYLKGQKEERKRVKAALALQGKLAGNEGKKLARVCVAIRKHWR